MLEALGQPKEKFWSLPQPREESRGFGTNQQRIQGGHRRRMTCIIWGFGMGGNLGFLEKRLSYQQKKGERGKEDKEDKYGVDA